MRANKGLIIPIIIFALLMLIGLLTGLGAQVMPSNVHDLSAQVDWAQGMVTYSLVGDFNIEGQNRPAAFYSNQRQLEKIIPSLLFSTLLPLQVDSIRTIGDIARYSPELISTLEGLSENIISLETKPSADLRSIELRFTVPIFPFITNQLVFHNNPQPIEHVFEWRPGGEYTGVVIHAADLMELYGEDRSVHLLPSIFPDLYDENMRLIVDKDKMDPDYLRRWGGAAFTASFDESTFRERIGDNPLRILASGAFGMAPTDVIIPTDKAEELLHNEENRMLLKEGRILIIVNESVINPRLEF